MLSATYSFYTPIVLCSLPAQVGKPSHACKDEGRTDQVEEPAAKQNPCHVFSELAGLLVEQQHFPYCECFLDVMCLLKLIFGICKRLWYCKQPTKFISKANIMFENSS